jgi:hypothetical protein
MGTPTLPPISERVRAGAVLLDQQRPSWHHHVDPDRIDMARDDDILTQLYGDYAVGLDDLFHAAADHGAWSWPSVWSVGHGFDLLAFDHADYPVLTACWRAELARRRGGERQ